MERYRLNGTLTIQCGQLQPHAGPGADGAIAGELILPSNSGHAAK